MFCANGKYKYMSIKVQGWSAITGRCLTKTSLVMPADCLLAVKNSITLTIYERGRRGLSPGNTVSVSSCKILYGWQGHTHTHTFHISVVPPQQVFPYASFHSLASPTCNQTDQKFLFSRFRSDLTTTSPAGDEGSTCLTTKVTHDPAWAPVAKTHLFPKIEYRSRSPSARCTRQWGRTCDASEPGVESVKQSGWCELKPNSRSFRSWSTPGGKDIP